LHFAAPRTRFTSDTSAFPASFDAALILQAPESQQLGLHHPHHGTTHAFKKAREHCS
jgi:hypothetical protein